MIQWICETFCLEGHFYNKGMLHYLRFGVIAEMWWANIAALLPLDPSKSYPLEL